jgi:hypothetical protein
LRPSKKNPLHLDKLDMAAYNSFGVIIQAQTPVTAVSVPTYTTASLAELTQLYVGQTIYNNDIKSLQVYDGTQWKCVAVPALTSAEIATLINIPTGEMVYNTTLARAQIYYSGAWHEIGSGGGGSSDPIVVEVSNDYSVTAADNVVVVDAAANDVILTLPLTNTRNGKELLVVKTDSSGHAVHIQSSGAEHIRTRTSTDQTLQLQDDRCDILPIATTGMWYLV